MVCSVRLGKVSTFFGPLKSNTLCANVAGVFGFGGVTDVSSVLGPLQPTSAVTTNAIAVLYKSRHILV